MSERFDGEQPEPAFSNAGFTSADTPEGTPEPNLFAGQTETIAKWMMREGYGAVAIGHGDEYALSRRVRLEQELEETTGIDSIDPRFDPALEATINMIMAAGGPLAYLEKLDQQKS